MALDYIGSTVDAALLASPVMSQTVSYRRPASGAIVAVDPFALAVVIDTGGEYADPLGGFYASVLVKASAIPLGPMKGDRITIDDAAVKPGEYQVQEIFLDARSGSAKLKIRWTGQGT